MACLSFMPKLFRPGVSMGGYQLGQSQEFSLYTYPRKWDIKIIPRSRPDGPRRGIFSALFDGRFGLAFRSTGRKEMEENGI